ncbi:hypothetical protein [Mahella australiensis]|uniref:Uncharacterized protein n=1 Tax=Mahella australiensis (strain DSM 15567 / CIP 107919 / 50-1 BON) TaxID=697281 RepID=F3ZZD9_MAHA5|nr:hypothetical protein [Mahella australiensis]AEE95749.1 hypothetical protein Mahau_0545 [Mahella australiensis 50-1 BON]
MSIYDEIREVEADISTLEEELTHPWSMADQLFLETELERMLRYRHKLKLQLQLASKK